MTRRTLASLIPLAVGALLAAPAGPTAPRYADAAGGTPAEVRVTAADVAATNAKVAEAYPAMVALWRDELAAVGARFAPPALVRFRAAVASPCGVIRPGNAAYCPGDNRIYFDDVFVAGQARQAALDLGTDGDMTAIGVVAHEIGHAVAIQLGHVSRFTYQNEKTADCLAGVFARHADEAGQLEPGDLDEAFYGMSRAGDPTPQLTGDGRVDRAILVRAALMGHGTEAQRQANFQAGLERGPGACLAEFR